MLKVLHRPRTSGAPPRLGLMDVLCSDGDPMFRGTVASHDKLSPGGHVVAQVDQDFLGRFSGLDGCHDFVRRIQKLKETLAKH